MRRLRHGAARLYPREWRVRYGEEFDALLDDMPPRWRDVVDITAGALVMHMSRLALVPVALAAAGGLAGAALSFATAPVYAASSFIRLQTGQGGPNDSAVFKRIQDVLYIAVTDPTDRKAISVIARSPMLIEVSGSANSALAAKQMTDRVVASMLEANLTVAEREPAAPGVQFRILDAATLPNAPLRDTTQYAAAGGVLGAVAGAVIALVKRRQRSAL